MRISVALATHDGERYLLAQLRSIASQTHPPAELVVCDDCSGDGTLGIVEQFRREAPFPVRVLPPAARSGPHESFVRAAAACLGEAVAFCDQDDIWLERKLERCADALGGDDVLLVVHAASVTRHDLRPTGRHFPRVGRSRVVDAGSIDPWLTCPGFAMVFRRSVLDWGDWAHRPPSHYWRGLMTHDEWIAVLAMAAGRTAFLSERLALHRQHDGQMFGAPGPRDALGLLRAAPPEAHEEAAALHRQHARYLHGLARTIEAKDGRGELHPRLERAAAAHERSALMLRGRSAVHRHDRGRVARMRALARLVCSGGYGRAGIGGLGRRALAHDALSLLSG